MPTNAPRPANEPVTSGKPCPRVNVTALHSRATPSAPPRFTRSPGPAKATLLECDRRESPSPQLFGEQAIAQSCRSSNCNLTLPAYQELLSKIARISGMRPPLALEGL